MSRLTLHSVVVPSEWIDYNGHMSEGYYGLVFSDATDALFLHIGADAAWRASSRQSLYTVETHIRYLREVPEGRTMTVDTMVLGIDHKRIHIAHELMVDGSSVATQESLGLAVDLETGRGTLLDPAIGKVLAALTVDKPPPYAGRRIALP